MAAAGDTQGRQFIRLGRRTGASSVSNRGRLTSDARPPSLTTSAPSTSSRQAQPLPLGIVPPAPDSTPASSTFGPEPVISVRESDREALAALLPPDLWKRIFGHLDEPSLVSVERVARWMFWMARQLERLPPDPAHEPWLSQARDCANALTALNIQRYPPSWSRRDEPANEQARVKALILKFEQTLEKLASSYRCLSFQVLQGRTDAVCKVLSVAKGWQLAVMTVASEVKEAFLAPLESQLRRRGVKRELHLRLASAACVEHYNPASPALRLTRLQLLSDLRGNLQPLQTLLASENGITDLSLVSNSKHARALVEALALGSHALQVLYLSQYASAELLATLALKRSLRDLGLSECRLRENNLTLAAILMAAPELRTLHLGAVKFEAGCTTGCAAALKASRLHTIRLLRCPLFMVDRHQGDAPQLTSDDPDGHAQFQQGLAEAPGLIELCLTGLGNKGELFALEAFARNPAARTVRVLDIKDGAQAATDSVRAIRERLKLAPLTFVYNAATSEA